MNAGNGKTPEGFQDHEEFMLLCRDAGVEANSLSIVISVVPDLGTKIIRGLQERIKSNPVQDK